MVRSTLEMRRRELEHPEAASSGNFEGTGRRPGPVPCRDHHGWERPLGSRTRSTQGSGPCRRSRGGPANGGIRPGVGDHHAHALRFFLGQLAPSARRGGSPDAPVPEAPGLRVRPPDGKGRAAERHRAAGPDPGSPPAQDRAGRGADERRNLSPPPNRHRLLGPRCAPGRGRPSRRRGALSPARYSRATWLRPSTRRAVPATWICSSARAENSD